MKTLAQIFRGVWSIFLHPFQVPRALAPRWRSTGPRRASPATLATPGGGPPPHRPRRTRWTTRQSPVQKAPKSPLSPARLSRFPRMFPLISWPNGLIRIGAPFSRRLPVGIRWTWRSKITNRPIGARRRGKLCVRFWCWISAGARGWWITICRFEFLRILFLRKIVVGAFDPLSFFWTTMFHAQWNRRTWLLDWVARSVIRHRSIDWLIGLLTDRLINRLIGW